MRVGQRVALAGIVVSFSLAAIKIATGLAGHSTAVVADGLESAGDVLASSLVLFALTLAAKPPDADHPYGHGRVEILTGLLIGLILPAGGAPISYGSVMRVGQVQPMVAGFVVWPLLISLVAKASLATFKFRTGARLGSAALTA